MIAKLNGIIDELGIDHLVIDVQGVGYLVFASARTLGSIGAVGEAATVFTEMQGQRDRYAVDGICRRRRT